MFYFLTIIIFLTLFPNEKKLKFILGKIYKMYTSLVFFKKKTYLI